MSLQISCTSSFSEPDDLSSYFQLLPSEVNLARVFYSIIKEYGWRRVALIVQNEPRFKAVGCKSRKDVMVILIKIFYR
jgi:hypothetical protein